MAGKRYKPALYELVGKGRVKPDDKGALVTPKWFYGDGEQQTETEPVRQEPKVIIHRGPQVERSPEPQPRIEGSESTDAGAELAKKEYGLQLGKQVRIWAPWWVMALSVLGLVLGFLVMYRIGQATVDQAEPAATNSVNPADTGPSKGLDTIREGPVQKGLFSTPTRPATTPPLPSDQKQTPPAQTIATGSLCLILCGSDKQRDLIDVQEYFTKKGILTRIGRMSNRYVLYTAQGVDSRTDQQANQLKEQVGKLGDRYNVEKPRTATSFPGSTFKTAYWVNRSQVTRLD
jgi:hypothetical protein